MTEIDLHNTLEELRKALKVQIVEPDLQNPKHMAALHAINIQSAEEGQLDFDSLEPEPMSDEAVAAWASQEYGDFKFIRRILTRGGRIIGEIHDYVDTHIGDVNIALEQSGNSLQLDPDTHVESCSFIL